MLSMILLRILKALVDQCHFEEELSEKVEIEPEEGRERDAQRVAVEDTWLNVGSRGIAYFSPASYLEP
jgi:hypothetical protein